MLEQLIQVGSQEGVRRIVGHIVPDNWAMKKLCRNLGFQLQSDATHDEIKAVLDLRPAARLSS
jgi:RimJ/RimL family protein N-acetyltransferase